MMTTLQTAPEGRPAALAAEHLDFVYAAALRQVRDAHRAADITQAVFLLLLQKHASRQLPEDRFMAGWLLKVTHYAVLESRRTFARRERHERAAAAGRHEASSPELPADDILPHVDAALLALPAMDRELLLRRYLEDQPVDDLARALGIKPNTASRRIERALEKLRKILTRRGGTEAHAALIPATLAALLVSQAAVKAPAALAAAPFAPAAAASLARAISARLLFLKWTQGALAALALLAVTVTSGALAFRYAFYTPPAAAGATNGDSPGMQPVTVFPEPTTEPAARPLVEVTDVIEEHSPELLNAALDAIDAERASLKTLHLTETSQSHFRRAPDQPVVESTFSATWWIDAGEPPRWRAEVESDGPENRLKPGASIHQVFTEVWDGVQANQAFALPKPHVVINASPFCYPPSTLHFIRDVAYQGGKLSVNRFDLARPLPGNLALLARRVRLNDRQDALEIAALWNDKPPFNFSHYYWFDESRHYALLASWFTNDYFDATERHRKYPIPDSETVVLELRPVSASLWLPTKVMSHMLTSSPGGWTRAEYRVLEVNGPVPAGALTMPADSSVRK